MAFVTTRRPDDLSVPSTFEEGFQVGDILHFTWSSWIKYRKLNGPVVFGEASVLALFGDCEVCMESRAVLIREICETHAHIHTAVCVKISKHPKPSAIREVLGLEKFCFHVF